MDPITMGLVSGGINVLSGLAGKFFGRGAKKEAERLAQEAYAEIEQLGLPPNEAAPLILEKFKSAGIYSPEMEQEIKMTESKLAKVQEDPRLRDAQMSALETLQRSGRTGLTAEDRASYNKLRAEAQRDAEAKRQQIVQNMQARGQAGGNAELVASLMASQAGADAQSEAGDRIAADASRRALESIAQAGQLGGSVRGQDLDYNTQIAQAADEMERFNIQNAINRQQRNVGARNTAQMSNLEREQAIMDANTQMANRETARQSDARRDYYSDLAGRAQARANAKLGQANLKAGKAAETAQMWQNIGSGAGAAASAYYQNQQKPKSMQDLAKKEETPDEYYMREGWKK